MIKTGLSVRNTVDSINEEFAQKVDNTTTIADLPLAGDILASDLLNSLFMVTRETADGSARVVQPIENGGTFVTQGEYSGEWF